MSEVSVSAKLFCLKNKQQMPSIVTFFSESSAAERQYQRPHRRSSPTVSLSEARGLQS